MSKTLSAAAQTEFDSEVKHAFQTAGALKDTVTIRNNVVGDTYKFRHMGKGLANQKPSQADVTPMDVAHSLITCTLENWNAPEYTDIFDAAEVNFDEQRELAQTIAAALGRRCDQLIIDAMAADPGATVDADVGGANTGLNVDKLRRASRELNDNGVPSSDRWIAVSALGLEQLLGETDATSADFNTVRALVNGEINSFVGFQFKIIESRTEGGLPSDGTDTDCFAWHKSAVGMAIGIDIRSEVNYIAQKTSWLCNGVFKAGAVVRDNEGVVKVQIDEAA